MARLLSGGGHGAGTHVLCNTRLCATGVGRVSNVPALDTLMGPLGNSGPFTLDGRAHD